MKKVKIMLIATAVCAVVGGALAFKAATRTGICYFSSTEAHDGTGGDYCLFNTATDQFNTGGTGTQQYATTVAKPSGGCGTVTTPVCPALVHTTNE